MSSLAQQEPMCRAKQLVLVAQHPHSVHVGVVLWTSFNLLLQTENPLAMG